MTRPLRLERVKSRLTDVGICALAVASFVFGWMASGLVACVARWIGN